MVEIWKDGLNELGIQNKQNFSLNGYENETNNQTIICHYHSIVVVQLYRGIKECRASRYQSETGKS